MPKTNHSLLFLILAFSLLISISLSCSSYKPKPKPDPKYTAFVKTACNATTYPSLCQNTCLPYASDIKRDPRKLARTALLAALSAAQTAAHTVAKMQKSASLSKYDTNVVKDCRENIGDSIDDIKDSIDEINGLGSSSSSNDVRLKISNIQTWMSAAITNENTCMDGIKDDKVSSYVKRKISGQLIGVAALTSNALSLCNHLHS